MYCPRWGSNSRPSDYETDALPTALRRHYKDVVFSKIDTFFVLIYWIEKAFKQFIDYNNNYNFNLKKEKKVNASAGNRTRVNCLEGSYAHHYTTDAWYIVVLVLKMQKKLF